MQVEVDGDDRGLEPLSITPLIEAVEDFGLSDKLGEALYSIEQHDEVDWKSSSWTFYLEDLMELCTSLRSEIRRNTGKDLKRQLAAVEAIYTYCHMEDSTPATKITFSFEDSNTKHSPIKRKFFYDDSGDTEMVEYRLRWIYSNGRSGIERALKILWSDLVEES